MTLLDRHLEFLEALRDAGLPVSLAEGLDEVRAVDALGLGERETLRAAYAATVLKRQNHRPGFDQVFDLYFPLLVGDGGFETLAHALSSTEEVGNEVGNDGPEALADFRAAMTAALRGEEPAEMVLLARDAVRRFGLIPGRGEGEQRWSSYNVLNRVSPEDLVHQVLRGLDSGGSGVEDDPSRRRLVAARAHEFEGLVEAEVRRRAAEVRGPQHVAQHTIRPAIEQVDFTSARRADLVSMRREIAPLARRLATRLSREQHARARGPLDFRRTVRASMSSGGVPIETRHKPKRPGRTDLVVLCDVSGSVANFASFTLLLVYALREQFTRVRAFTFVDEIHEVTDRFLPGADPARTISELAASARHATLWGRTNYGRAFTRFAAEHPEALTPRTNLLVLGDARSNHADLALPVVKDLVYAARRSWWLNPEHSRNWDTGDSAAREYGRLLPMVECRNLTQLGEFVYDLA